MATIDWKQFGLDLQKAREDKGWSQRELAKKCGCQDNSLVSRVEQAVRVPTKRMLERLSLVFPELVSKYQDAFLTKAREESVNLIYSAVMAVNGVVAISKLRLVVTLREDNESTRNEIQEICDNSFVTVEFKIES